MEIKILKELGKELNVLYMEDEGMIRQQMEDILKNLFKSVTTAVNGQEGVDLFMKGKYDIVITDIQMPLKNGLEAAREIRAISPHTPIVVTTAYSDSSLFLTSIELGIDRYILKPISVPNLFGSLQSVAEALINKRKAEELHRKVLLEEINETASDVAKKLADAFPTPSVAFSDTKLKFANESFAELFGEENLKALQSGDKTLSSFFEARDGFLSCVNDINNDDAQANRAILKINGKKHIFLVAKREITILQDKVEIYTLSNITKIEYQKRKNQGYAELLEEILFSRYKRTVIQQGEPETKKIDAEATVSQQPQNIEPKDYLYLSQEEKEVLRRTHTNKYTALEYTDALDEGLIDEVDELGELEGEWRELVCDFEESGNWIMVEKVSVIIQKYSRTIGVLIEFEDLSYALSSLSKVLTDIEPNETNRRVLLLFLDTIRIDLCDWRNKIFIQKTARDIHYLDSSLFSSCLQLQLKLGSGVVENDDNDLELF